MGINVSISETYDLKTRLNKMTLIGIHTPKKELIMKTYPGLCMNSRFVKIKSIDVVLSAVSQLAVSPDQVGEDATKIAPQDMLNPILYKAVSNESMSTLETRLQGLGGSSDTVGNMVNYTPNHVTDLTDEFGIYYALLQDRDGFRIAHPQQGLSMKGLVPLVFEKYYNVGVNVDNSTAGGYPVQDGDPLVRSIDYALSMRGKAHPMPRFNTTYLTSVTSIDSGGKENGMGDGSPRNAQIQMPDVLPVYCGMILMPPSARTIMFYRMRVTCHLEFQDVRPIQDITTFSQLDSYSAIVYHSDYTLQSKMLEKSENMVDTSADIEKIMEGR